MHRQFAKLTATLVTLGMMTGSALAQLPGPNVPELESDRLVDEGLVEAEILAADYDARTLTVRFDASNETAKLIVPENADLFMTRPNDLERRIELTDLNAGDRISVQATDVEGVIHVRIVGLDS